jgi:hypothetical protein
LPWQGCLERDVTAVVYVGFVHSAPAHQRGQKLVRHRAGYRGHRGDERFAMRPDGRDHALRHRAAHQRVSGEDRRAQGCEFAHQCRQDVLETADDLGIRGVDLVALAQGFHDAVDRAVLQVQPAVCESQ